MSLQCQKFKSSAPPTRSSEVLANATSEALQSPGANCCVHLAHLSNLVLTETKDAKF